MNILLPSGVNLLENLLPVAGCSLATSQGLKFLLAFRKGRTFSLHHLMEPGGMPSSHAALVSSLATTMGLLYGWASPYFQLAAVFGCIVIYDAITLRRAVGEHARHINMIHCRDQGFSGNRLPEKLGHTPLEVTIGILIGVLITLTFI
ncbi:divergent PAP2 family protein [Desulfotruncus alcoholivorax]|uniref:divergent PAP2 family protein n=1 Tax=Desulfotruncus alcoholivorax TaxID=265477 RepID=UPI000551961D|nr:divergent PAP2 family protein [Desulfotruncus alcoholivorax]